MEEKIVPASLAALAQPVRRRAFRAIVGAGPEGVNPGALSGLLAVPSSTLSFHLEELVHAGLVSRERDGRNLIDRPSLQRMAELFDSLGAHCCLGAGCEAIGANACTNCEQVDGAAPGRGAGAGRAGVRPLRQRVPDAFAPAVPSRAAMRAVRFHASAGAREDLGSADPRGLLTAMAAIGFASPAAAGRPFVLGHAAEVRLLVSPRTAASA